MLTLFLFVVVLAALALSALRWGFNSSDGMSSSEWQRRQQWYGFH